MWTFCYNESMNSEESSHSLSEIEHEPFPFLPEHAPIHATSYGYPEYLERSDEQRSRLYQLRSRDYGIDRTFDAFLTATTLGGNAALSDRQESYASLGAKTRSLQKRIARIDDMQEQASIIGGIAAALEARSIASLGTLAAEMTEYIRSSRSSEYPIYLRVGSLPHSARGGFSDGYVQTQFLAPIEHMEFDDEGTPITFLRSAYDTVGYIKGNLPLVNNLYR